MPKKRKPDTMPVCDICTERMEVVRVIPSAGTLPELKTYRCTGCECFATLDAEEIKLRADIQRKARAGAEQARELSN